MQYAVVVLLLPALLTYGYTQLARVIGGKFWRKLWLTPLTFGRNNYIVSKTLMHPGKSMEKQTLFGDMVYPDDL